LLASAATVFTVRQIPPKVFLSRKSPCFPESNPCSV
jgi:hypothetical protein